MKFPKNRANLYLVERWTWKGTFTTIIGGFSTPEAADDFKEACEQEWIDKGFKDDLDNGKVQFKVILSTYYG